MSEIKVNFPEPNPVELDFSEMEAGDIFQDSDGDFCVVLNEGILNLVSDGGMVFFTFEEAEHYSDVFAEGTLRPDLKCSINIERES